MSSIEENQDEPSVIQAAGGLLWRDSLRGREVALVRRQRYGTEWCLPKGKLEPGEPWERAAQREVMEETHCQVRVRDWAGSHSYLVAGRPKLVLFWHMDLVEERSFLATEETKARLWCTVPEALLRLTHDGERAVLAGRSPSADPGWRPTAGGGHRLERWFRRSFLTSSSARRLSDSLAVFQIELEHLICVLDQRGKSGAVQEACWAKVVRVLIWQAHQALAGGEEQRGWRCLLAAQRMELYGLRELDEKALRTRADTIRAEGVAKLRSWRKDRITELLSPSPMIKTSNDSTGITVSQATQYDASTAPLAPDHDLYFLRVCEASQVLHEHFTNEALKRVAGRQPLRVLVATSVALIAFWLIVLSTMPWALAAGEISPEMRTWRMALVAVTFGMMGACLSGIISLAKDPANARIPDVLFSHRITLTRLVVGAISGLVVHLLVLTEVLRVGNITPSPALTLLVGLAAGFSERLVTSALGKLSGDSR